jgi:hypothetical protein
MRNPFTHRFLEPWSSSVLSQKHLSRLAKRPCPARSSENEPVASTIRQAVAETMSVLPRDATHGPVVTHAECATITIHSATLQAALGSPDAEAFFGEGTSYDPALLGELVCESLSHARGLRRRGAQSTYAC